MTAKFITFEQATERFRGKRVAVVGSAPSCLNNKPGFVDGHDVVVRVNNFKLGPAQGKRTDVHHSFYGSSIKVSAELLKDSGVSLCMCKCPDGQPIESEWHVKMNKMHGVDYRYIYKNRRSWWFCDTFIPTTEHFLRGFNLLGRHQPTSGFAAILDVLSAAPKSVYLTGFDFFTSNVHNVNEPWRDKNLDDPIRHRPDLEAAWIFEAALDTLKHPLLLDTKLQELHSQWKRKHRKMTSSLEPQT